MSTQEAFRAEIEAYLEASKMSPAAFGVAAVNDPNFVLEVRKGRAPSLRLVDKVQAWIADHPPETIAGNDRGAPDEQQPAA